MTGRKKYKTGYLFPRPSIIQGVGSIINIAGNHFHFNYSKTEEDADSNAIENDWGMVGNDILVATKSIKKKLLEHQD